MERSERKVVAKCTRMGGERRGGAEGTNSEKAGGSLRSQQVGGPNKYLEKRLIGGSTGNVFLRVRTNQDKKRCKFRCKPRVKEGRMEE